MPTHVFYQSIIKGIKHGKLKEPFSKQDLRKACPGLGEGTYEAFLQKHRKGNPDRVSELFEQVAPNRFIVLRPFKYCLDYKTCSSITYNSPEQPQTETISQFPRP